jgi:hypothetical protein
LIIVTFPISRVYLAARQLNVDLVELGAVKQASAVASPTKGQMICRWFQGAKFSAIEDEFELGVGGSNGAENRFKEISSNLFDGFGRVS